MLRTFIFLIACFYVTFAMPHGGANTDPNEISRPDSGMIPLPIHLGMDGSVMWGYMLPWNSHGGMGNMGSMNGGSMGHNSDSMGQGSGSMGQGSGSMGHDSGSMGQGNGQMGNDQNGDMNMDHQGGEQDHSQMSHNSSSKWSFMAMPMLYLGGDYYTRIIKQDKTQSEDPYAINIDSEKSKYIAIQNKSIQVGGGVGIMANPPISIPMLSFRFNFMPYKGGHVFRMKHIDDRSQASSIGEMKVPQDITDLGLWAINDRMSFSSNGGVMFGAGIGYSVLASVMTSYMVHGEWITSVAKAGPESVLVNIRKSKMKMSAKKVGNTFVDFTDAKMASKELNFSFMFDLSTSNGQRAYTEMLAGNILAAQDYVKNHYEGVDPVSSGNSIAFGKMRSFNYGIPVLFRGSFSTHRMQTTSVTKNYMADMNMKMHMGMYRKEHSTSGVISDHKNAGIIFMSGVQEMKSGTFASASMKWYFQKEDVSNYFFHREIRRLVSTFGLDKARNIKIPTYANMGFVRAEVDLGLSMEDTLKLMKLSTSDNLYKKMYNSAYNNMNTFFAKRNSLNAVCGKLKKITLCKKRIYRNTWSAISAIPMKLSQMSQAWKERRYKAFAELYSEFGKIILTNRFVLKQTLKSIGKEDVKAILKIQGSRISKTEIKL